MRRRSTVPTVIVIIILIAVLYYAYGNRYQNIPADLSSVGEYTGDAATTTRIKAAISLNKQVANLDIHVETNNSNVTLTGRVPTENDKRVAEEIVRGTRGVDALTSNLQVDPGIQAASSTR